jgi:hypothetical protein
MINLTLRKLFIHAEGPETPTEMSTEIRVFCGVMPCGLVARYRCLGETVVFIFRETEKWLNLSLFTLITEKKSSFWTYCDMQTHFQVTAV